MACEECKNEDRDHKCETAASRGHLACLIWARKIGCKWNTWECKNSARNGHLLCLMWARKNGCPWDESTCTYAAYKGQIECLKWAKKDYSSHFTQPQSKAVPLRAPSQECHRARSSR